MRKRLLILLICRWVDPKCVGANMSFGYYFLYGWWRVVFTIFVVTIFSFILTSNANSKLPCASGCSLSLPGQRFIYIYIYTPMCLTNSSEKTQTHTKSMKYYSYEVDWCVTKICQKICNEVICPVMRNF